MARATPTARTTRTTHWGGNILGVSERHPRETSKLCPGYIMTIYSSRFSAITSMEDPRASEFNPVLINATR